MAESAVINFESPFRMTTSVSSAQDWHPKGHSVVVMGVAGCGKSSLAALVAQAHGWELVEGDEYHDEASLAKMRNGQALTDEDRKKWFALLAQKLSAQAGHIVLACSALKKAYRDVLRAAVPELRFVFLKIDVAQAHARVTGRGQDHYFPPALVDSQFEALQEPCDEARVLTLDAMQSQADLMAKVNTWLDAG